VQWQGTRKEGRRRIVEHGLGGKGDHDPMEKLGGWYS